MNPYRTPEEALRFSAWAVRVQGVWGSGGGVQHFGLRLFGDSGL